jgi:hypothetical protein
VSRVIIFSTVIGASIKIAAISAIELSSVSGRVSLVIMVRIVSATISAVSAVSCHIWSPRVDNKYLVLRSSRRAYDMLFIMLSPLFPLLYFRYPKHGHCENIRLIKS